MQVKQKIFVVEVTTRDRTYTREIIASTANEALAVCDHPNVYLARVLHTKYIAKK